MTIVYDINNVQWLTTHDLGYINAKVNDGQTLIIERPPLEDDNGAHLVEGFYEQAKIGFINAKYIVGAYEVDHDEMYLDDGQGIGIGFRGGEND